MEEKKGKGLGDAQALPQPFRAQRGRKEKAAILGLATPVASQGEKGLPDERERLPTQLMIED